MLTIEGVNAGYAGVSVLRDVSLVVPSSSVVALLGPNGAGKTTLLRVASGLLRPASGRVTLNGEDVTGLATHQLSARGLCHVPEGRGVFPPLTVRENLVLFAAPGAGRAAIEQAVDVFPRLGDKLEQSAGTMSGGEQQMLALARAYLQQPRVVLLDEVSMGLAPKVVDEIFAFLRRLADEGVALLLVEQYVSKALAIADFVAILSRGRLVYLGEPSELAGTDIFAQYLGSAEQVEVTL
jgi:branched-chain amino acid transport system ATP-binding protein